MIESAAYIITIIKIIILKFVIFFFYTYKYITFVNQTFSYNKKRITKKYSYRFYGLVRNGKRCDGTEGYLLQKEEREKENEVAKIVIKTHTFLFHQKVPTVKSLL